MGVIQIGRSVGFPTDKMKQIIPFTLVASAFPYLSISYVVFIFPSLVGSGNQI